MSESLLKKEFKHSDVERIRNLVKKDFVSKTRIQEGYSTHSVDRKEGDVWEEGGKQWTVKNGLRQSVTRLDGVKKLLQVPLKCPKCGGSMKHHLHRKMYKIHGFCFDCTVKYEDSLQRAGLYDLYERRLMQGNMKGFAKDLENWVKESLTEKVSIVTEDGDIENWSSLSEEYKNRVLQNLGEYTKMLNTPLE